MGGWLGWWVGVLVGWRVDEWISGWLDGLALGFKGHRGGRQGWFGWGWGDGVVRESVGGIWVGLGWALIRHPVRCISPERRQRARIGQRFGTELWCCS